MRLSGDHIALLTQLATGSTLKSHREIDGEKVYRLHLLDGTVELPNAKIVDQLKRTRYIDSNKKFPAATYLLTAKGCQAIADITHEDVAVLSIRNPLP